MRKYFMIAFVLAAMLVFATSGLALEKTSARFTGDTRDDWNSAGTCSVAYYNFCTGWVWIWSGWTPGDRIGVCFDSCCGAAGGVLDVNWLYAWTGAPSGYGFTGTINVAAADANCCPAGNIASQIYLPVSGWNGFAWGTSVPSTFVIYAEHGNSAFPDPTSYASDHPAAGPTGPAACGSCYPTTRVNHSFYYGTAATPLCPGSSLFDGTCDAQLLWDAAFTCPVSVDEASWGSIKNLYR